MKRLFFICLLFTLPLVSSLSTTLHESYQPRETILIEIQGPVLEEIAKQNVQFFRGHVQTVFDYDIKRLGEKYFIYAIAPENENNFTLKILNVHTSINGEPTTLDYSQNFSIFGPAMDYTIKPGFIISDSDFDLILTLNKDTNQDISIGNSNETIRTLKPGDNKISFSIADFPHGLSFTQLGTYYLPVYNLNVPSVKETKHLRVTPGSFEENFIYGSSRVLHFKISNIGPTDLSDITFTYDKARYVLSPESLSTLPMNDTAEFNLTIVNDTLNIDDILQIHYSDETLQLPIKIDYTQNAISNSSSISNASEPSTGYYCRELNGNICQIAEVCSGQLRQTLDGSCCIGTCAAPETTSYAWVGYLIGAIILIILVIVGARYYKSKSSNSFQKKVSQIEKKI